MTLIVGPLAAYLVALGILQGGRQPVIVPGSLNALLLGIGLGGLLLLGPVGGVLLNRLCPSPNLWAWLAPASTYGLLLIIWCLRASKRLVADRIRPGRCGTWSARPFGAPRRVHPDGRWFRGPRTWLWLGDRGQPLAPFPEPTDTYGRAPGALITTNAPVLGELANNRPAGADPERPILAFLWFGLSILTVLIPFAAILLG